jgi:hypothetical protein
LRGSIVVITSAAFALLISTSWAIFRACTTRQQPQKAHSFRRSNSQFNDVAYADAHTENLMINVPIVPFGVRTETDGLLDTKPADDIGVEFYRKCWLGTVMHWTIHSVTVLSMMLFIVILCDQNNNCQVLSLDALCRYGDNYIFGTRTPKVMMALWCFWIVWISGLLMPSLISHTLTHTISLLYLLMYIIYLCVRGRPPDCRDLCNEELAAHVVLAAVSSGKF